MTRKEATVAADKYVDQIIETQQRLGDADVPEAVRRAARKDVHSAVKRFSVAARKAQARSR